MMPQSMPPLKLIPLALVAVTMVVVVSKLWTSKTETTVLVSKEQIGEHDGETRYRPSEKKPSESSLVSDSSLFEYSRGILEQNLLWTQNKNLSYQITPKQIGQQIERMSRVKMKNYSWNESVTITTLLMFGCCVANEPKEDGLFSSKLENAKVCHDRVPRFSGRFVGRYFYISYRGVDGALLPKTGSTNILRTICILVGTKCTSITGYPDEYHYVPRFTTGVSNLTVYTEEMNNWSTRRFFYVFVRNPWQRLVSTYIEKVLFTDSYIAICSRYGNKKFPARHKERKARNETFTFEDFLECCVIEHYRLGGMNGMEPHYKPQSLTGTFCDVSYSFIGKIETYGEDIKVIYAQFGVKDIPALIKEAEKYRKPNEKAHLTSKGYTDYWMSIDDKMVDQIRHIYGNDFAMFNYPTQPLS